MRPRDTGRRVVTAAALAATVVLLSLAAPVTEREAAACSCVGPRPGVLALVHVDDAPLDMKVRVEVPRAVKAQRVVLREPGGREVATTSREITGPGWLTLVELSPVALLSASTRYEVAILDPVNHPSTTVLATFKTGTKEDKSPPVLSSLGRATAARNGMVMSGMCQTAGPWVVVEGVRAEDPGRPNAQLLYGVWTADAAGKVDVTKPPAAILERLEDGSLELGRSSSCDPHDFAFPKVAAFTVGIAAIDEAGNVSPPRTVRVDLANAVVH